ncbi:hypothetical protein EL22_19810 [Halostagnicola sp. A56]|uniref:hypothetical protein n=1 Tax=Halostagnicola sp. A56 TaxID=1495067 RepID=UPI0004A1908D|nr:hypothetical protein [Halostagnicola sp. A56]KDE56828.1 hypothetical protein EL22_19810 [Halostagnicola sp. A56]
MENGKIYKTVHGALNRLDELTDPIRLDREKHDIDAYLFAVERMAKSAMKKDELREAHRLLDLRGSIDGSDGEGRNVEIPRSDALRLSVTLHSYREKLLDNGDEVSASDVERSVTIIDQKLEQRSAEMGSEDQ